MKPRKSFIALVLTNLIPVLGVVFLGWDVHAILALFWFETIVILGCGLFRELRMKTSSPATKADEGYDDPISRFFPFIFGGGLAVLNGIFVFVMVGPLVRHPELAKIHANGRGFSFSPSFELIGESLSGLFNLGFLQGILAVLLVYVSKLFYDSKKASPEEWDSPFFGRTILLTITLIVGALVMVLQQIEHGIIYVFVGLKLSIDLLFYWLENREIVKS